MDTAPMTNWGLDRRQTQSGPIRTLHARELITFEMFLGPLTFGVR
ncbi:MAG: hypothetical protein ABJA81_10190 [Nocardioidaceae bacterium]